MTFIVYRVGLGTIAIESVRCSARELRFGTNRNRVEYRKRQRERDNQKRVKGEVFVKYLGAIGARQRSHQVQFLALLVGVDGRSLVVIDQLVERMELALSDAVHARLDVHAEVLVAAGRFKAHGIVAHLEKYETG